MKIIFTFLFLLVAKTSIAINEQLAVVTPSFHRDLKVSVRMYNSFQKFLKEKDQTPFYFIVPDNETQLFENTFQPVVEKQKWNTKFFILSEKDVVLKCGGEKMLEKFKKMNGWRQQQVRKLCFAKLNKAQNYITVDSDSYLTENFSTKTLMAPNGKIKTLMPYFTNKNNQKQMQARWQKETKPFLYDHHNKEEQSIFDSIDKIKKTLNDKTPHYNHYVQTTQLWNSQLVNDMNNFLQSKGYDFVDIIQISPWEINWYTTYLITHKPEEVYPINTIFRMTTEGSCYSGHLFNKYYGISYQYSTEGSEYKECNWFKKTSANISRTIRDYMRSKKGYFIQ
ncbi:MAG: hypothetical protein RL208_70 [Pseudomonadota bacterium]|jgi:hypothetical protein